jgi:ribonucleoside-diphosphate reductase alpha chain
MSDKYHLKIPDELQKEFNIEFLTKKWDVLPDYVKKWDCESDWDPSLIKITTRKWGRRDYEKKNFVETPGIIFFRTAHYAAQNACKRDPHNNLENLTKKYFEMFSSGSIMPNTPYMSNGGHISVADYFLFKIPETPENKKIRKELGEERLQKPQTSACFVLDMSDDLGSILQTLTNASIIQAHNGGTGFNFRLRPAQEPVRKSGGHTDGPVSFMEAYAHVLGDTINQGGKRKGANMFILDCNSPDLFKFLYAKTTPGNLSGANLSVGISSEFMNAYFSEEEDKSYFPAINVHSHSSRDTIPPHYSETQLKGALNISRTDKNTKPSILIAEDGKTLLSPDLLEGMPEELRKIGKIKDGEVYFNAKAIMKHIAYLSHTNGEPGIVFLDRINESNPTHPKYWVEEMKKTKDVSTMPQKGNLESIVADAFYGRANYLPVGVGMIRSTNPCGEQPLLGNESCVLGHVNWEKILVKNTEFPSQYHVDYEKLKELTRSICSILDDSIDYSDFILPQIEETHKANRKIGMGFMGLAEFLAKLEMPYDSEESRKLVEEVWKKQKEFAVEISRERARTFGEFPNFRYSKYKNDAIIRNATTTTVAPTGTTSLIARTSGGVEPLFGLKFVRTTSQGTSIEIFTPTLEEKLGKYRILKNEEERKRLLETIDRTGSIQEFDITHDEEETEKEFFLRRESLRKIKSIFKVSNDIKPEDHILMQAAIQKYTDNAVSKTINFANNVRVDDVEKAYALAYKSGCIGCTFYRDGSRRDQPLKIKGTSVPPTEKKGISDEELITEVQRRLELSRPKVVGTTVTEKTPHGTKVYVTTNLDRNTGRIYEAFFSAGKSGSNISAMAQALGRVISVSLQSCSGGNLEALLKQIEGIGGEDSIGFGEEKIRSLPDAIAKGIKKSLAELGELGLLKNHLNTTSPYPTNRQTEQSPPQQSEKKHSGKSGASDFNVCPDCGARVLFLEGCQKCSKNCGWTICG